MINWHFICGVLPAVVLIIFFIKEGDDRCSEVAAVMILAAIIISTVSEFIYCFAN